MSLRGGWLRDHADDCEPFTGWVGDDFWTDDMILDPVPGFSREATLKDVSDAKEPRANLARGSLSTAPSFPL